jgi:hypothetical protein
VNFFQSVVDSLKAAGVDAGKPHVPECPRFSDSYNFYWRERFPTRVPDTRFCCRRALLLGAPFKESGWGKTS